MKLCLGSWAEYVRVLALATSAAEDKGLRLWKSCLAHCHDAWHEMTLKKHASLRHKLGWYSGILRSKTLKSMIQQWLGHLAPHETPSSASARGLRAQARGLRRVLGAWGLRVQRGRGFGRICNVIEGARERGLKGLALGYWWRCVKRRLKLQRSLAELVCKRESGGQQLVLLNWHELAHRRFHVASMLDKILIRRRQRAVTDAVVEWGSPRDNLNP
mmetsp:Transcript_27438/g.42849  ORF Transcript_27438/g.42849 Transcript_27438/m.42849 type:complete len:216 (-) Transcript_27438:103-750(-)